MLHEKNLAEYIPILRRLLSVLEVAIVVGSALIAHCLVTLMRDGVIWWPWPDGYQMMVTVAGILTLFVFYDFGLYRGWRGETYLREIRRVTVALSVVFVCLVIIAAATKTSAHYSRLWAVTWYATALIMLWGSRYLASMLLHMLRSKGRDRKRIVIMGAGPSAKGVLKVIGENPWTGYQVDGYFGHASAAPEGMPVPHLGSYEDLADYLQDSGHKEVWIALSSDEHYAFRHIVETLSDLTVDVRYIPDLFNFKLLNASISHVAGLPLVNMSRSPMSGMNGLLKSLEDKVIASVALIAVAPLMLLIAVAIKLSSPGPVIFKQKRHGWHGLTFEVYKFRTMRVHEAPDGRVVQAKLNDDRVFALGRFLRRTSLDELPQLFNVLQGGMSIVGPRPHAVEHNDQYRKLIDNYAWRHKVKPGITGWAQINGFRGETSRLQDMARRVEYDLYYIENWSLWFDIKILLLTLVRGWTGAKVY